MSALERCFKNFDRRFGPFSKNESEVFSNARGDNRIKEIYEMWEAMGSGEGFCTPETYDETGNIVDDSEYVVIFSPTEANSWTTEMGIQDLYVFGSNGGGELIALFLPMGFGLQSDVSNSPEDFYLVAGSLEDFFAVSEKGGWFDELGRAR